MPLDNVLEPMHMQLIPGPLLFLALGEEKAAAWVRGYARFQVRNMYPFLANNTIMPSLPASVKLLFI